MRYDRLTRPILYATLVAWSYVYALAVRLDHLIRVRPPMTERGVCPLCGSTLGAPHQRPPRVTRQPNGGKIKQLRAEVLTWRSCTGCTRYQVGEIVR